MTHAELPAPLATPGQTIAEMAQRDLDAALQLLADRAQYITGANGAAIALRRHGKKDMLCRASTGSNVPELGALLSTEFGLSGESVRTRQPMRCDDAARDARVNHDVCREMGIASVVVMPVVNDDEVLGVFELFSGKVNAFAERDLSALQRLSGLVETAVRLAQASERISAGMKEEAVAAESGIALEVAPEAVNTSGKIPADEVAPESRDAGGSARATQQDAPAASAGETKKTLFWSAALDVSGNAHAAETDQSQVPPMLRNLRKCQACGFPVSSDRTLCVECEEKKWRGQLRVPKPVVTNAISPEFGASAGTATAPSKAVDAPRKAQPGLGLAIPQAQEKPVRTSSVTLSDVVATQRDPNESTSTERVSPDGAPILTGGLVPPESWFSANKYILGAVLVVAIVVAAILLLR
jgi:hypothetical protein